MNGLDKRQCSMQVALTPEDDDLRISVIFQGTGKHTFADEKKSYHKSCDVYWQANPWADANVCVDWTKNTLAHL